LRKGVRVQERGVRVSIARIDLILKADGGLNKSKVIISIRLKLIKRPVGQEQIQRQIF
jgi:hypothetical protein